MGDAPAAAAGGGGDAAGAPAQPQQNPVVRMLTTMLRMYMMYSMFKYMTGGNQPTPTAGPPGSVPTSTTGSAANLFPYGTIMDMQVRVSETPYFNAWDVPSSLAWQVEGLQYGDWSIDGRQSLSLPVTQGLINNGSIYAHIYLYVHGASPDPSSRDYDLSKVSYTRAQLNRYAPRRKIAINKNLITGEGFDDESIRLEKEQKQQTDYISYWTNNVSIAIVTDQTVFQNGNIPEPLRKYYHFEPKTGNYYPVVWINRFWTLDESYYPINETLSELPLHLDLSALSFMKWAMLEQFESSMQMQGGSIGDEFKYMLMDNNPMFLLLTFVVSLLHSAFDFLAFKNDITFWKDKKNMEGLSLRTIFVDFASQLIVLLYLFDNDTSWTVLISSVVGVAIEAWKIPKAFIIERKPTFPFISFKDRQSYTDSRTKEFDEIAYRYLTIASIPLMIGYAIYSLLYNSHKGWYSYIISTLVGFVYTFGFIKMTPQLFINYKLKTVAHMPWRTFTYKALNTVVDDLFAFVIRMPLMHRIACFRDDVIFLIYLYQRYIYPVDKKRANEFGQVGEEVEEDSKADAANKADADADADVAAADAEPKSAEHKKND